MPPEFQFSSIHGETRCLSIFFPPAFGFYQAEAGKTIIKLFFSSPTFELGLAVDDLYDSLFWSWTGEWSDQMEALLAEVLVRSQEDLKPMLAGMSGMMQGLGGDMNHTIEVITDLVHKSSERHDKTSVGHLHSLMYQFLQMSSTINLCPPFQEAIRDFEIEKVRLSDKTRLQKNMEIVVQAINGYLPLMMSMNDNGYRNHWSQQQQQLALALKDFDNFQPSIMWKVNPMLLDTLGSFLGGASMPQHYKLKGMQKVPANVFFGNPNALENYLNIFSECLMGGAILLDGFFGYQLGKVETDVELLANILAAGCGYVTEGKRVHITFDVRRAALPLTPTIVKEHKKLKSRSKDVKRVLRNFEKPLGKFSLRVNTDFDTFLSGLREHHTTSWVSDPLVAVWRAMVESGQLVIFELWYGTAGMIAADVGHPANGSFYVATRWFNHEFRRFQPGFMLALLESEYLRKLGFAMIDYGGVDSSPMMSYKYYVAKELLRPEFLYLFRESRESIPEEIPDGILVEECTPDHVLA